MGQHPPEKKILPVKAAIASTQISPLSLCEITSRNAFLSGCGMAVIDFNNNINRVMPSASPSRSPPKKSCGPSFDAPHGFISDRLVLAHRSPKWVIHMAGSDLS